MADDQAVTAASYIESVPAIQAAGPEFYNLKNDFSIPLETPFVRNIRFKWLVSQTGSDHFDWNRILAQNGVVKLPMAHRP